MAKHQITVAIMVIAACLLPAIDCGEHTGGIRFEVVGKVFCDTCLFGYETRASTYIEGAKVMVECKLRATGAKTCRYEGVTDSTGTYRIPVKDDHEYEKCESVLVSSPDSGCAKMVEGREKAPVFLTTNNGIASSTRFANALGFQKDARLAVCDQILKEYQQYDV